MIHEIYPKKYSVEYEKTTPAPGDTILAFDGDTICCHMDGEQIRFPKYGELKTAADANNGTDTGTDHAPSSDHASSTDKTPSSGEFFYLFSIDDEKFFMPSTYSQNKMTPPEGYAWHDCGIFRMAAPRHLAFAAVTAQELYLWYKSNRYCGSCGVETIHSETERACICPKCGLVIYPRISPVVIVAVTNGEYLLVTRYKDRPFRRYALVAGFVEIGESLEDTVRREVFEETGVHVKNIRYYKSQPWGFTSTLLSGFYCDLDGDPTISIDNKELSEAIWILREDIPPADSDIALTSEMMENFRVSGDDATIHAR
ncbi:MAG: NAD(+) diphosphatase [Oscillospiraceae bacterium]|nr:NAD(+) diphosphatase [Oscillospiraceae bacterium]